MSDNDDGRDISDFNSDIDDDGQGGDDSNLVNDLLGYTSELKSAQNDGILTRKTLAALNGIVMALRRNTEAGLGERRPEWLLVHNNYKMYQTCIHPLWRSGVGSERFDYLERLLYILYRILTASDGEDKKEASAVSRIRAYLHSLQEIKGISCCRSVWDGLLILSQKMIVDETNRHTSPEETKRRDELKAEMTGLQAADGGGQRVSRISRIRKEIEQLDLQRSKRKQRVVAFMAMIKATSIGLLRLKDPHPDECLKRFNRHNNNVLIISGIMQANIQFMFESDWYKIIERGALERSKRSASENDTRNLWAVFEFYYHFLLEFDPMEVAVRTSPDRIKTRQNARITICCECEPEIDGVSNSAFSI
eukprot:GHVO01041277.1.p1 GENE.GHVO01041277.1~~GHVO01041277.1.p1  ORF type:complete len:374 (+),score=65.16 GHVO01041277.1:33-1124(+)